MSKVTILKGHSFDPNLFVYTSVKPNQYGGKASYINYEKHNVRIETPKMFCRWGIATYPPNDPNPTSYSIQLEFPKEMDENTRKFHNNVDLLDQATMRTAMERSKDWLGKATMNEESAKQFYSPLLIKHTDEDGNPTGKYADSIRLKLPLGKDGNFSTKCYNQDKKPAQLKDVLQKGCYVRAILELNGVNLKKNAYSLSCKALQLQVFPATKFTGYAFLPDEDDDEVLVGGGAVSVPDDSHIDDNGDGGFADNLNPQDVGGGEGVLEQSTVSNNSDNGEGGSNGEGGGNGNSDEENNVDVPETQPLIGTDEKEVPVAGNSDEEIPSPQPKKKSRFTKKK